MIYADFDYYKNQYFGVKITDENEFKGLAVKSTADLNALTFNHINFNDLIIEEVKNAMCAIVDARKTYESGEAGIASATIGKKSITYANADQKTLEKDIYKAAYPFLVGTGLLYRGVYD